jgi:hypothetical protein
VSSIVHALLPAVALGQLLGVLVALELADERRRR